MKIRIMSDLHLEFEKNYDFVNTLDSDADVVILAGDICVAHNMLDSMTALCEHFKNSTVLWVHGNHEYYGSDKKTVEALSQTACSQNSNLRWLSNSITHVDGLRFLGTTLWFESLPDNRLYEHYMNDFNVIRNFRSWIADFSTYSRNFLNENVKPGDVVITHHLPASNSIHKLYTKSPLNRFFVTDMKKLIEEKEPRLWIHGHTHHPFDYKIKNTRIVCNPRGYPKERERNGDVPFQGGALVNIFPE